MCDGDIVIPHLRHVIHSDALSVVTTVYKFRITLL